MKQAPQKPKIDFTFLKPYIGWTIVLIIFLFLSNGATLLIPRILGASIDNFSKNGANYNITGDLWLLAGIAVGVLILTLLQIIISVYVSERVAKDLRADLIQKIVSQPISFVNKRESSDLFTNITSDTEQVKDIIFYYFQSMLN
jgi:ABC-type multidrug transport system fused ATPase/permease subunit